MNNGKESPRYRINRKATPDVTANAPGNDYLGWLCSITPGRRPHEIEWRLMEAERLDERSLEEMSQEVHAY